MAITAWLLRAIEKKAICQNNYSWKLDGPQHYVATGCLSIGVEKPMHWNKGEKYDHYSDCLSLGMKMSSQNVELLLEMELGRRGEHIKTNRSRIHLAMAPLQEIFFSRRRTLIVPLSTIRRLTGPDCDHP